MTLPANVAQYLLSIPCLGQDEARNLKVVAFDHRESMSSLYQCDVVVACEDPDLVSSELIGRSGRLIVMNPSQARYIHGEITALYRGERNNRNYLYRFRLEPKLAFLQYRSDQRIFQNMTVPDIVRAVLDAAGIANELVKWSLSSRYEPRLYCTQYGETDFEFVQRLLAEEGLFYFFEQDPQSHSMVISDSNICFKPIEGGNSSLLFRPQSNLAADPLRQQQSISWLQSHFQVHTESVTMGDYNHQKSKLSLVQKAGAEDVTEHYHFSSPQFAEPELGRAYAQRRQQSLAVRKEFIEGQSDCPHLRVGGRFRLQQHPYDGLNKEYLVTEIQISGEQPQALEEGASSQGSSLSVEFEAVPAAVQYRPTHIPAAPRIAGTQTAFVTGPKGEEIYTDSEARVKVQFHWDRASKGDEASSCWLRVSQALAGNQWGALVIPRVGQEVVVAFLNGDPDRPMVMGTVYNGDNKPPYPLPEGKTQTLFKSFSSPGGNGFNELRMDDTKGKEQLYLHAERDLNLLANNQWKETIGEQHHTIVGQNHHLDVSKDWDVKVSENTHQKVEQSASVETGHTTQVKITGSYLGQASQGVQLQAGTQLVMDAAVELTVKAGSSLVKIDPSGVTVEGAMVGLNSPLGGEPVDLEALIAEQTLEGLEPEELAEKFAELDISVDPEYPDIDT